jgi:transposase InsO family protein
MRKNGLNATGRRKFIPTTNSRYGLPVCESILSREFHAEGAGQKWVSAGPSVPIWRPFIRPYRR